MQETRRRSQDGQSLVTEVADRRLSMDQVDSLLEVPLSDEVTLLPYSASAQNSQLSP
jgi:hypothetical protein